VHRNFSLRVSRVAGFQFVAQKGATRHCPVRPSGPLENSAGVNRGEKSDRARLAWAKKQDEQADAGGKRDGRMCRANRG